MWDEDAGGKFNGPTEGGEKKKRRKKRGRAKKGKGRNLGKLKKKKN